MANKITAKKLKPFIPIDPRFTRGMWPIPYFTHIPMDKLKEIARGLPRYALQEVTNKKAKIVVEGIDGGIRRAHLHLGKEVVFLDKAALQKYLKVAAKELDNIKDITKIDTYIGM